MSPLSLVPPLASTCLAWGPLHVCVYVCGYYRFYQVFPLDLSGHTAILGSGHSPPIIAGLRCRPRYIPVLPLNQCDMHFRPEPDSLPQDHPGSGVVAPWLPLGQLHVNSSTSPSSPCHPVCCVCNGAFTAGGARGSGAASTAYSRHARSGDRSHDLLVARPTLSPVELAGDPCGNMCVHVSVCVCVCSL